MTAPYTYTTLGAARQQLANRLYDSGQVFWIASELNSYLAESLRTWNALTSYWRSEFTFPLQQNRTFYDITDPTIAPNTLRPLTLQDTDLYSIMQFHLLEPPGLSSLQFTTDDFIQATARRRDEILSVTGCTLTTRLVPAVAGRILLPDSVIDIRRVAYLPTPSDGTPYGIGLYGVSTPQSMVVPIIVSYTMVATVNGANMDYTITSNSPGYPLTSSFSMPINPVPSGGPVDGQFPPYSSAGFVMSNPSGTPGGSIPVNFLFDGVPYPSALPLALIFYAPPLGGGLGAFTRIGGQVLLYYIGGPQLYSDPTSAPTMLAGTFTLTAQVGTTTVPSEGIPSGPYGGSIRTAAQASTLWPEDNFAEQAFNRLYTLAPAGQPPGAPSVYMQSTEPPISFDTDLAPSFGGFYELLTIDAGPALSSSNPAALSIPDDWTHIIKWGALADLLSRESNAKDPSRAAYCEQRYKMGLALLSKASALLALRVANIPLPIDAITAGDHYNSTWERATPGRPQVAYHAGLNLVAVSPVSDVGPYVLTATVVQNAPVPLVDGDFLQVSRGDLDAVLDYAQHLAAFKMGGLEFTATLPLFQRFLASAASYGLKLSELGEYTSVIFAQSQRDAEMHPRFAPASDGGA